MHPPRRQHSAASEPVHRRSQDLPGSRSPARLTLPVFQEPAMDCIDHRVAIVTGGARGIGAAITTTLARAGYHVAAGYSTNQAAAEQFTGKLISEGLSLSVHKGNVGEPGDCLRVTGEVLSRHGRVDVLVN